MQILAKRTASIETGGQISTLASISALYVGFGMTMGVVQGALPAVMRAQGMNLGSTGWLYALYLPLGLAFLWSPLIDRIRPPMLTPKVGWIILMQTAAVVSVVAAAFLQDAPAAILFLVGLFLASAIATMDVALDALAVGVVKPAWRPNAAAAKLGALSLGAMIGGGAFLALFQTLGWKLIFLTYAACLALLMLPILSLTRIEKLLDGAEPVSAGGTASLMKLLADRRQRKRLVLLTLACCVIFPLSGLSRLMLIDLGLTVEEIGWTVGTLGPVMMFAASIVSMPLMLKLGVPRALIAFTALGLISIAAILGGCLFVLPWLASTGAVLVGAAVSGIYVGLSARILGWAVGAQPATDYAAFYGVGRFASTLIIISSTQFIALVGWPIFYGVGAVLLATVVALLLGPVSQKD